MNVSSLVFDPADGSPMSSACTAWQWRKTNPKSAWLVHPWTGQRRRAEDVYTDPTAVHLLDGLLGASRTGDFSLLQNEVIKHQCGIEPTLDNFGNTPLLIAAANGQDQLVAQLLSLGASARSTNAYGVSLLHLAAFHSPTLRVVVATPAALDVQARDRKGTQPLTFAIRLPLAPTATDEERDAHFMFGTGPYDFSQGPALMERILMLLEVGAPVNARTESGRTALMNAARLGYAPLVELLISAGADPMVRDNEGNTAAHYASDDPQLREMLQVH